MKDSREQEAQGIPSYSSPRNLGDRYLSDLFSDDYVVQEKVDGSQFSFGRVNGELLFRSRGGPLVLGQVPNDFQKTVDHLLGKADQIPEGFTFRGEAMTKRRQNKLNYLRIPDGFLVLFDVDSGGTYHSIEEIQQWAERLGVTAVQQLWTGKAGEALDVERVNAFLNGESQLGGTPEGVVIKNYARLLNGKAMMGKVVGSHFKEVKAVVKEQGSSPVAAIVKAYRTEARWDKAIQHLREEGKLDETMRDVPVLLKEIFSDIEAEESENLKNLLWQTFRKDILKGAADGFASYYQKRLSESVMAGAVAQ